MGRSGGLTVPQDTSYRWLNGHGRWPGASVSGLRADGEQQVLPVTGMRAGEPWVATVLVPEGDAIGLVPRADGSVLVGLGADRVLRVTADGEASESPEPLPDPPEEDTTRRAARLRVGGVAAVPAPDPWGTGFVVVAADGVHLVPDAADEPPLLLTTAAEEFAGIAVDHRGRLLLAGPRGLYLPVPRHATRGVIVLPAPYPPALPRWDRVTVELAEPAPPGTHVRIWTRAGAAPGPADIPPPPPEATARAGADPDDAAVPTPADRWRAGPLDCLDVRVLAVPQESAPALWVAVELLADGTGTPRLDDVRVACAGRGLLDELPAAYTGEDDGSGALGRLLGLFSSVHADVTRELDLLPSLLDPAVAPDRPDAPWLSRLAAWVDCPLDAQIPLPAAAADRLRRAAVAGAFAAHARGGTPAGLVEAVRRATNGVEVRLVEPARSAAVWRLDDPECAVLGSTTQLLRGEPGPPTLGGTAVLDGSALIGADDCGLPLYASVAHRACVLVPADRADVLPVVRRVVERERPAHVAISVRTARPGEVNDEDEESDARENER